MLVLLSVVIAALASFTALDLATRIRASTAWVRHVWLAAAAVAMGGGIWAMHFVGMLAFSVHGIEVSYDLSLTLLSLILPILVTAFGFFVASRHGLDMPTLLLSGLAMGLGIAAMHYTGMAAIRLDATMHHQFFWVVVSILIAIAAATAALWLAFRRTSLHQRLLAAVVMGLAVSGMHYAAMQGAVFTFDSPMPHAASHGSVSQTPLALWVTATSALILILALLAASYDRHLAHRAAREARALKESEERFRLLVQSVTDYAIFMLDRDGFIANWNAGAERIKGYSTDEVVGSHFSRFYTPEDIAAGVPSRALETAARDGKFEHEGWRVKSDGSRFWASVVIDPIRDEQGELLGFAKVTRDITERKQTQAALEKTREALAQAQKMEAVGQLTGGVAHDFNNLLMAVLGSLELLRRRVPEDPKILKLIDNAIQGAERGAALTQRMLAFARRQDLKPEPIDLPDLVRGMADLLKRSIGPRIHIETRFPLGVPRVLADSNQLELALLNLAVNARDAMPQGGHITIAAREESGGGDTRLPEGRYVCLSVADTGQGMDAATLARAQEPFFTTKGVGKGTGLGLSMVHGLAAQSRGRLVLISQLGQGTTAEIWLPVTEAAATGSVALIPEAQRPTRPETAAARRILVVDDDVLVLENTSAMLEDLGHTVLAARSGPEALKILQEGRGCDLVITDQVMPGMTGLQLAEKIWADQPGQPLILATGYADWPAGAYPDLPRLTKPFDQETLSLAVDTATKDLESGGAVLAFRPKGA
ncbi:sensor histidine kinase [Azorhizobium oxalatiphilum]|uniref:histidine kinase n=2 Tax=Azorhizobium oxalatiphilum TaxID=980631 RepID=A0A917FAB9_9HYPH|nr:sensor histidine kinase [Azorhizobium oxalatiphilum]